MRLFFLLIMCIVLSKATPLSLKNFSYFSPTASVNIVVFYAPWCPPCQRTLTLMKGLSKKDKNLHISFVDVTNKLSFQSAKELGLSENIPYILVADYSGTVVKRFEVIPDKNILTALIQRLTEGRLENGTLQIERRVDTWNMNRKGM